MTSKQIPTIINQTEHQTKFHKPPKSNKTFTRTKIHISIHSCSFSKFRLAYQLNFKLQNKVKSQKKQTREKRDRDGKKGDISNGRPSAVPEERDNLCHFAVCYSLASKAHLHKFRICKK